MAPFSGYVQAALENSIDNMKRFGAGLRRTETVEIDESKTLGNMEVGGIGAMTQELFWCLFWVGVLFCFLWFSILFGDFNVRALIYIKYM